jgi:REP element-mobilizing transposase RayT
MSAPSLLSVSSANSHLWGGHFWLQPPFRRPRVVDGILLFLRVLPSLGHHILDATLRKAAAPLGSHWSAFICHLPAARQSSCRARLSSSPIGYGRAGISSDGPNIRRRRQRPLFLRQPEIAKLVVDALLDGERNFQRYQLHSFVVMPNHVHMLVTPNVDASRWLGPLKEYTGYQANRILCTHGRAFWQNESYDHLVRSDSGFDRVRGYIEQNPVTAGLVTTAEDFRWSSAWAGGAA